TVIVLLGCSIITMSPALSWINTGLSGVLSTVVRVSTTEEGSLVVNSLYLMISVSLALAAAASQIRLIAGKAALKALLSIIPPTSIVLNGSCCNWTSPGNSLFPEREDHKEKDQGFTAICVNWLTIPGHS